MQPVKLKRISTMVGLMETFSQFSAGVFHIEIVSARLQNNKRLNVFVKVEIFAEGEKNAEKEHVKKTKPISGANPLWDENFDIVVPDDHKFLRLSVISVNKITKNDVLGTITMPINTTLKDTEPLHLHTVDLIVRSHYVSSIERNADFTIAHYHENDLTQLICDSSHTVPRVLASVSTTDDTFVALVRFINRPEMLFGPSRSEQPKIPIRSEQRLEPRPMIAPHRANQINRSLSPPPRPPRNDISLSPNVNPSKQFENPPPKLLLSLTDSHTPPPMPLSPPPKSGSPLMPMVGPPKLSMRSNNFLEKPSLKTRTRSLSVGEESSNLSLTIVSETVCDEISRSSISTLFRTDSAATRLCKSYFKLVGYQYLRSTLSEVVLRYVNAPIAQYEIDPEHLPSGTNIESNVRRLSEACRDFLIAVVNSEYQIPFSISRVLASAAHAESVISPNSSISICALFFLRFLCPAILFPDSNHIYDGTIEPESRRVLTLITKGLQLLVSLKANTIMKEPYMDLLSPFLNEYTPLITHFVERLKVLPSNGPPDLLRSELNEEDYRKLLSFLIHKLRNVLPNIDESVDGIHKDEIWSKSAKEHFEKIGRIIRTNY